MREKHEWQSIKIWGESYRRLKVLSAKHGKSLAQLIEDCVRWNEVRDLQEEARMKDLEERRKRVEEQIA